MNSLTLLTKRPYLNFCKVVAAIVKSLSHVSCFLTPEIAALQAPLPSLKEAMKQSFTISWSRCKSMSIEVVMLFNHFILNHLLLLLPSVFLSIKVFSSESPFHIRQPKCWSLSFKISPSNEYSGSISFKIDWFDLLAVQGALRGLLQHHSLKHQFFGDQPS